MFKATYTGPAHALVDEKGMVKRDKRNADSIEKGRTDQVSNKVVRAAGTIVCGVEMKTNREIKLNPEDKQHAEAISVIEKNIKGTQHLDECAFTLVKIDGRKKAA